MDMTASVKSAPNVPLHPNRKTLLSQSLNGWLTFQPMICVVFRGYV
jgi:hypothetical protein